MSDNFFKTIWENRSLILLFAVNDVRLRYRNSVIGFFWTILEPLLMLSILYFVFTTVLETNIENYPLYLLLGLIIWYMFSRSTMMGLGSLKDRSHILKTFYFRREIFVISSCLSSFIMMIFEFSVFAVFIVAFQFVPPITIVFLPLLLVNLFLLTLGVSFFLSVFTVHFNDIRFIWQIALQAGFFLSPIFYKFEMLPESIRHILLLNPIVPLLDTAHKITLYGSLPTLNTTIFLITFTASVFVLGYLFFKIKSKTLVENL